MIGWNNVNEMTGWACRACSRSGTFDTWSPGYLMFMAATHNGISRLYETFGNSGSADTWSARCRPERDLAHLVPAEPAAARVQWSLRNNNNYEQTGLLVSLNHFANNRVYFLRNFYEKSKRSILKAKIEGPAAYVLPANDPRPGAQAELLRDAAEAGGRDLARDRARSPSRSRRGVRRARRRRTAAAGAGRTERRRPAGSGAAPPRAARSRAAATTETREFPAGSYIVRMDQPYRASPTRCSTIRYWAPNDPQAQPVRRHRLDVPRRLRRAGGARHRRQGARRADGAGARARSRPPCGVTGTGSVFAINHNADNALITLRYRLKDADIQIAEEPFESGGQKFTRGSFIISGVSRGDLDKRPPSSG